MLVEVCLDVTVGGLDSMKRLNDCLKSVISESLGSRSWIHKSIG